MSKYSRRSFCLAAMLFRITSTALKRKRMNEVSQAQFVTHSRLAHSLEYECQGAQSYFVDLPTPKAWSDFLGNGNTVLHGSWMWCTFLASRHGSWGALMMASSFHRKWLDRNLRAAKMCRLWWPDIYVSHCRDIRNWYSYFRRQKQMLLLPFPLFRLDLKFFLIKSPF